MILIIHHKLHLTKDQRYLLHKGENVETIGISIPVWMIGSKTTEPASEVFCKYVLKNTKEENPIKITDEGYEITIPAKDWIEGENISNEKYWKMTEEEKYEFYKLKGTQASSKNLLDIKDGGSGSLAYREHNKINHKNHQLSVVHFVNIESIEHLIDSIPEFTH